jgi:hypothetical protein
MKVHCGAGVPRSGGGSNGNNSRRFDGSRHGLVGDQLAQERNQQNEATTILARACART